MKAFNPEMQIKNLSLYITKFVMMSMGVTEVSWLFVTSIVSLKTIVCDWWLFTNML